MTGGTLSVAPCRDMSGVTTGSCCEDNWLRSWRRFRCDSCRDRSRHVAKCRDSFERCELLNLRDVTRDRLRRHQILVAGCRRYFLSVEVPAGAISLQASKRTGMARSGITFCDLFKRQGKVRVGGCRVLSR